jgi:hypothetical protein
MTQKFAFATIAMIISSSGAFAAPTYFSCEFAQPTGATQVFNFALDADAGTFGVYVPASGSQRTAAGTFTEGKAGLNEGSVAWEIDLAKGTIIRDKRMVGEKDTGTCKTISAEESGFEE